MDKFEGSILLGQLKTKGRSQDLLFVLAFFVRFYSNATSPNEVRIMGGSACGTNKRGGNDMLCNDVAAYAENEVALRANGLTHYVFYAIIN